MPILILSIPTDYHAAAVAWGLRKKGEHVDLIYMSDLPQRASLTYAISNEVQSLVFSNETRTLDLSVYDTVVFRRIARPELPDHIDYRDREAARQEWIVVLRFVQQYFDRPDVFVVNSPLSRALRDIKPLQLLLARELGLRIPKTMISNRPTDIRGFVENTSPSVNTSYIVKPLHPSN